MKLGVVVLNYNDYKTTEKCVEILKGLKSLDHIVVVDNHSPNDSFSKLESANDGTWDLIQTDKNKGYAFGNNAGAAYLLKRYNLDIIGIVNPDIILNNDCIDKVKAAFSDHQEYSIITGVQLNPKGETAKRAFWEELDFIRLLVNMSAVLSKLQSKIKGGYVKNKLRGEKDLFEVATVEGCCFFVKVADWVKIGGFDEGTFLFFEEDILTQKIKKLGKKTGICPDAFFIHNHSTTINKALNYFRRNSVLQTSRKYYFYKYLQPGFVQKIAFKIFSLLTLGEQIFIVYPYLRYFKKDGY